MAEFQFRSNVIFQMSTTKILVGFINKYKSKVSFTKTDIEFNGVVYTVTIPDDEPIIAYEIGREVMRYYCENS